MRLEREGSVRNFQTNKSEQREIVEKGGISDIVTRAILHTFQNKRICVRVC